jgi:hypothetical protein
MQFIKRYLIIMLAIFPLLSLQGQQASNGGYVAISQAFLQTVRMNENADSLANLLADAGEEELFNSLQSDADRKAFWLNIYNGFTVYLLSANPALYEKRNAFFSKSRFTIAGNKMSLDDVEHGILRRNKIKWSKGYLGKWFPKKFNKKFRVDTLDARIHFALNCGAKSCPPIAFYEPERMEQQLQLARRVYMKSKTEVSENGKVVYVPKILSWFSGDFGGKKGIRNMLASLDLIEKGSRPSIKYLDYDWTLNIGGNELK